MDDDDLLGDEEDREMDRDGAENMTDHESKRPMNGSNPPADDNDTSGANLITGKMKEVQLPLAAACVAMASQGASKMVINSDVTLYIPVAANLGAAVGGTPPIAGSSVPPVSISHPIAANHGTAPTEQEAAKAEEDIAAAAQNASVGGGAPATVANTSVGAVTAANLREVAGSGLANVAATAVAAKAAMTAAAMHCDNIGCCCKGCIGGPNRCV